MYRKIALIFFALAFVVVIAGVYFFFWGKAGSKLAIFGNKDTAETATTIEDQTQTKEEAVDLAKQQAAMVAELKQTIKSKIKEKDALIRSTGTGRPYTQDEVDFVLNPRENVINEMKTNGEITDEQIILLYSKN